MTSSLCVGWRVEDRPVLVVGGGKVGEGRVESLLPAKPQITVVSPGDRVFPRLREIIAEKKVTYHDRKFRDDDLLHNARPVALVCVAIDDPTESRRIAQLCREMRIPVNVGDVPPLCDFYFGAMVTRGPLQIMISTVGKGPRLARRIKEMIDASIPPDFANAIENVGLLRQMIRKELPQDDMPSIDRRMAWMSDLCDTWSFEELARMTAEDRDLLVKLFLENQPPPRRMWNALSGYSTTAAIAAASALTGACVTALYLMKIHPRN